MKNIVLFVIIIFLLLLGFWAGWKIFKKSPPPPSNERTIVIIEGWTTKDIADYLVKEGIIGRPAEFTEWTERISQCPNQDNLKCRLIKSYDFLNLSKIYTLEGYLFPDTYRIYKNSKPGDIIKKMLDNFDKRVDATLRAEIKKQGKNFHQIVTLASIIEREIPKENDRRIVADILWNRLRIGMPLQTDSTLNYYTGRQSRALSTAELNINSPYNTYKFYGLPPTPISNPGLSALRAAIYPQSSPYWYFLSGRDGKTYFSVTLTEHNVKKMLYLNK